MRWGTKKKWKGERGRKDEGREGRKVKRGPNYIFDYELNKNRWRRKGGKVLRSVEEVREASRRKLSYGK